MRIHSEHTQEFIYMLATAIAKDPASLEHWLCLHISHTDAMSEEWIEETLNRLQDANKHLDCDVIHCLDHDVFFISRHMHVDAIYKIADDFTRVSQDTEGKAGDIALYNMHHDWRILRTILLSKTDAYWPIETKSALYNFGEIRALEEVFTEAKKLRNARLPAHIMVVEDDPLTRRIVTSAFKENYALISASTAHEAVANYLMHAPDIVFLDIGLPDTSGFDVLHQIMASDPNAYVVMFSGNSYLDNVASALSEGASGFISKPFKKEKMQRYISESAIHHRQHSA